MSIFPFDHDFYLPCDAGHVFFVLSPPERVCSLVDVAIQSRQQRSPSTIPRTEIVSRMRRVWGFLEEEDGEIGGWRGADTLTLPREGDVVPGIPNSFFSLSAPVYIQFRASRLFNLRVTLCSVVSLLAGVHPRARGRSLFYGIPMHPTSPRVHLARQISPSLAYTTSYLSRYTARPAIVHIKG